MFQNNRASSILPDVAAEGAITRRSPDANQFSADVAAGRLMDDLFQEVEQLLGFEPSEPINNVQPDVPQPPEIEEPEALSPALPLARRPDSMAIQPLHSQAEESLVMPATADLATPLPPHPVAPVPATQPKGQWDRLLFVTGCMSIIVSLALWLLYQEGRQRQQVAMNGTANTETAAPSAADQQFADYLQRSLTHIDQQTQSTTVAQLPTTPPAPGTPTVVIPKTSVPLPSAPTSTRPGREYVPVYQLPANLYPSGAAIAPLPHLPGSNLPNQRKPIPGSTLPKTPTASAPTVSRKLVGVLDQGNNSVALIEIDGVTQRFQVGESISSSGWTLVEVSKNQAIIRRNGDVRSLFVGHTF